MTIKWDYRLCSLGATVLGVTVCVYEEGLTTSTLNITMNITNDCQITSAPNISFGTAAFPADFAAVSNSLGVSCTLLGAYTVKLVSTHPDDANWRRMTATVGGTPTTCNINSTAPGISPGLKPAITVGRVRGLRRVSRTPPALTPVRPASRKGSIKTPSRSTSRLTSAIVLTGWRIKRQPTFPHREQTLTGREPIAILLL
nr:spore coat protein U domain-containing protein [Pectobacterium colocasium]